MRDTHPFFTIGIPVYNAEKYLSLCINSILRQSFLDFELILVNDGSTDSSLDICKFFEKIDNRIKVFDQDNEGVSSASNKILENATGEYVFLMDNDDEMFVGMLENVYNRLSEKPVDILIGGYYVIDPNGEKKLRLFRNPDIENGFARKEDFLLYAVNPGFPWSMWTKVVSSNYWKQSQIIFNSRYDGCQDEAISFKLMEYANTIAYTDDLFITWFHPREGSISTEWSFKMMRNYWRLSSDLLSEVSSNESVSASVGDKFKKSIMMQVGSSLWRITSYNKEQLNELDQVFKPIQDCIQPRYATDRRDAFLFWCISRLGTYRTAMIIKLLRNIKEMIKK